MHDPVTEGPRGGRVISYNNVERKLTNTEFVTLIANAWVGTTEPQSSFLEKAIRSVVERGKTVTFAIKHRVEPSAIYGPDAIGSNDATDDFMVV